MADKSHIEWTDATWNIVTGCGVVSLGCTNCYAMRLAGTRLKNHPSRRGLTREVNGNHVWTGEVRVNWEWIDQPLEWAKARRIFVAAHGDLFHEAMELSDIATIFGVMVAAHHLRGHVLQVLTKRADRMRAILNDADFWEQVNARAEAEIMERVDPHDRRSDDARATCREYGPDDSPPGIWLGVTAEDQQRADERIPDLLATPAAVRFVSIEPMLGAIDLGDIKWPRPLKERFSESDDISDSFDALRYRNSEQSPLDWVIAGGESGPGARPMNPAWARSLRDQCTAAGVSFFFKQWGEFRPLRSDEELDIDKFPDDVLFPTFDCVRRVGKARAGRLLDGVEHSEFPEATQ